MTQLATKALKRKNFSFKKPKYEDPSAPYIGRHLEKRPRPKSKGIPTKMMKR